MWYLVISTISWIKMSHTFGISTILVLEFRSIIDCMWTDFDITLPESFSEWDMRQSKMCLPPLGGWAMGSYTHPAYFDHVTFPNTRMLVHGTGVSFTTFFFQILFDRSVILRLSKICNKNTSLLPVAVKEACKVDRIVSYSWIFPPLVIPFKYWITHVTFVLLYIRFRFSTRILHRGFQALQMIVLAVFDAVE